MAVERLTADEQAVCARMAGSGDRLDEGRAAVARRHGVHPLLAGTLTPQERETPWGRELVRAVRVAAALDTRRDEVLRGVLDALGNGGVTPILIKGAALAYTIYEHPWLRPRADIDVLIERSGRERCDAILRADGWTRDPEADAELASTQRHYSKTLPSGLTEFVDLHWKIANPPLFANAVDHAELLRRAVPIPALGVGARTVAVGDALFVACIHLAAHHAMQPRLLWLLDIHRLAERLTPSEAQHFLSLAEHRGMRAVCRYVLELSGACFGGSVTALADSIAEIGSVEPSARVLQPISRVALVRADLAALGSWRERTALIREHLFPSAAYLRTVYPGWPAVLLPVAALHRIVAGAPKWFRPPRN